MATQYCDLLKMQSSAGPGAAGRALGAEQQRTETEKRHIRGGGRKAINFNGYHMMISWLRDNFNL